MNSSFWRGKEVLLTGHTGFKGGWLSLWLQSLGAQVHGYALSPSTEPNFFTLANVSEDMASNTIADIRDAEKLFDVIDKIQPQIVFHMAAQPLVRYSYAEPVETYAVNVMGTLNLLEAVRQTSSVKALVNVTTDKCYENHEWSLTYKEDQALGGYDPYSSSKACSEIITAAYRKSFLTERGVGVASARAGNVIGGGDYSKDRLIPDFFRAIEDKKTLMIRSPNAIRPWQHVLEPLSGYLKLAECLYGEPAKYSEAWNFGPSDDATMTVSWILNKLAETFPNSKWEVDNNPQFHEASLLRLDSSKARALLGWQPRWSLDESLKKIVEWQNQFNASVNLKEFSHAQIASYTGAIS